MNKLDFSSSRIAVIGDVMLDIYHYGKVERISPEAPVPVMNLSSTSYSLGGAANVANNLVNLGAQVFLFGLAGRDENYDTMRKLMDTLRINNCLYQLDIKTCTKIRIVGEHQQIVRMDIEQAENCREIKVHETFFIDHVGQSLNKEQIDVVIISDYAKGVCSDLLCRTVIAACEEKHIPVIVDPKGINWEKYSGAYIVTPNFKEFKAVVNKDITNTDSEIESVARNVLTTYKLKNLIVTRSEKGMSFIDGNEVSHFPTEARQVFDVSGAGDTVIATLGACISKQLSLKESIRLSNKAAGIVVGKVGTAPITSDELNTADADAKENGLLGLKELVTQLAGHKARKKRVVFTNGCFDILHRGHITILKEAKKMGDILVVGLNSDSSVRELKGPSRPVNHEQDRAFFLLQFPYVDYVIIFSESTPYNILKEIRPDILVKGGDYKPDEVIGAEFAGEVKIINFVDGYSSTKIISRMKN